MEPRRFSNRPPSVQGEQAVPAPINPITLGVIWGALQSIAVEIGTTVHKTAYSEQAREGQDFSVAVFDARGRMVAQGPYSPGHMGAMSFAVRNALAPGARLEGPAIVEERESTSVLPPGVSAMVDEYANLIVTIDAPTVDRA